jgi:hypothetical protein
MPKGTGPGRSTVEVAALIGVPYGRLWRWVDRGYIPGLVGSGTGQPLRWQPGHITSARMVKARLEVARDLARIVPAHQQGEGERLTA